MNLYFIVKFNFNDIDESALQDEIRREYIDLLEKIKGLIKGHGGNARPRFTTHNIITEVWDK